METKSSLILKTWNGIKELPLPYVINENGCFICQKYIKSRGYPYIFDDDKRLIGAHRYIYELLYGRLLLSKIVIRHYCDNPACINPNHLTHGLDADNVKDKVDRGRCPHGEKHHSSKLNDIVVSELRSRYKQGETFRCLAREYGVDKNTIADAIRKVTWKHVE